MPQSSVGDHFDLVKGGSDSECLRLTAKGWFDVKHQCGKTGEITDHSGPNAITEDGLLAMIKGFGAGTGTGLTATTTAYIRFSDVAAVAITAGEATGGGGTVQLGEAGLTAGTGTAIIGSGTAAYFGFTGPTTIFEANTPNTTGTVGDVVLTSKPIQCVMTTGTGTINCIQIVDDAGSDRVLAARSQNSGSGSNSMTAISLANTDTLTVTYTLTLTATA